MDTGCTNTTDELLMATPVLPEEVMYVRAPLAVCAVTPKKP
jgi:hypothetical protein